MPLLRKASPSSSKVRGPSVGSGVVPVDTCGWPAVVMARHYSAPTRFPHRRSPAGEPADSQCYRGPMVPPVENRLLDDDVLAAIVTSTRAILIGHWSPS